VIRLADVISDLRSELYKAIEQAEPERLQFELGPVELELSVAVEQSSEPHAKVRFWVVDVGVDASLSRTRGQTIKLTLHPSLTLPDGSTVTPKVAGQAEDGED
jgi:hypothetical protein